MAHRTLFIAARELIARVLGDPKGASMGGRIFLAQNVDKIMGVKRRLCNLIVCFFRKSRLRVNRVAAAW
jgi:hypothetical protein